MCRCITNMFLLSFYYLLILLIGESLSTNQCNQPGIFPSIEHPQNFIVCKDENGTFIRSELACNNFTYYTGIQARCAGKYSNILSFYNLINFKENDDVGENLKCLTPGVICSDCKTQTVCEGDVQPNGTIIVNVLLSIKCGDGKHCAMGCGCTNDKSRLCSSGMFQCDDFGVFPDPYDCQKYHVCYFSNSVLKDKVFTCPGSFDSKTDTCGHSLNSESCMNRPVPLCKSPFQMGTVTDNLSMYYICVKDDPEKPILRPSLHRCPPNLTFNATTYSCV